MSLKHQLTKYNLKWWPELAVMAFDGVAESKHYKALYEVQKTKSCDVEDAVIALLENKELSEACLTYINKPEIYVKAMKKITQIDHKFTEIIDIPIREADFTIEGTSTLVGEDDVSLIYFWIDEGVELDIENNDFQMSRLLQDIFTDTLLYNSGDGWSEYIYNNKHKDFIASKVALAFRDYLADKQLLGDSNVK